MNNADKIRTIVVDDSGFMRLVISDILNSEEDIVVISTARDGKEAVEQTLKFKPDVVLMDLVMGEYDGFYGVQHIMNEMPTPIIIVSSFENTNADAVFDALKNGAYDFVKKPESTITPKMRKIKNEMVEKVRLASKTDPLNLIGYKRLKEIRHVHLSNRVAALPKLDEPQFNCSAIVIGASTGGPVIITQILRELSRDFSLPIFIGQHLPPVYTASFVERLDTDIQLKVKQGEQNEVVKPGHVYVSPSDKNMIIRRSSECDTTVRIELVNHVHKQIYRPSIDTIMQSVASIYGAQSLGLILSGLEKDGVKGIKAIHEAGGMTIAQKIETCTAPSMVKYSLEANAIKKSFNPEIISQYLQQCVTNIPKTE